MELYEILQMFEKKSVEIVVVKVLIDSIVLCLGMS
jgi:hypothetical protein